MYRLCLMSGRLIGCKIVSVEDDMENIQQLADEGTIVIITDDYEDAAKELCLKVEIAD